MKLYIQTLCVSALIPVSSAESNIHEMESLEAAQWSVDHTGKCAPYTPSNDALNKAREVYYRNN